MPEPLPTRNRSTAQARSRRTRAGLLWAVMAAVLLAACSPPEPPLAVGTYPWPGFATLYYAQSRRMLSPETVRLLEFGSAREVMGALRSGTVDAGGMTLDEAVTLASGKNGFRIVMTFDFSAGADVLLARPSITSLRGLRGKRVGVEAEAEGEYILRRILDIAHLRPEEVQIVDLPLDRHVEAYRNMEVDAVITFDPARIELVSAGARELFSSRDIASEIMDVLVVREEAIRTRPRALTALVRAHFQAVEDIRENPAEVAQAVAPRFGPPGEVIEAWRLLEFQGRIANQRLLSEGGIRPVMAQVFSVVSRTRSGGKLDELSFVDDSFVRGTAP